MARKDYYTILGVAKDASPDDIKSAWREFAKTHHPDKGGDTKNFQEGQEAYEILSDPQKRAAYDNPAQEIPISNFGDRGFGSAQDWVEEMMFGGRRARQPRKPITQVSIGVPIQEMYKGSHKKLQYQRNEIVGEPVVCAVCNGAGFREERMNIAGRTMINQIICQACGGRGTYHPTQTVDRILEVDIPVGCPEPYQILFKDAGSEYEPKLFSDILLTVTTIENGEYAREGQHLLRKLHVPFPTLIIGGNVMVDVFGTKYKFKINGGDKSLQPVRLRGKGFNFDGKAGDLYVELIPDIPDKLTEREKTLLKELSAQPNFSLLSPLH